MHRIIITLASAGRRTVVRWSSAGLRESLFQVRYVCVIAGVEKKLVKTVVPEFERKRTEFISASISMKRVQSIA